MREHIKISIRIYGFSNESVMEPDSVTQEKQQYRRLR